MIDDFLQLCCQERWVNDISDLRHEDTGRLEGWCIDLTPYLRFRIKNLGNGDVLFDRPQFLYKQNEELKGKDFKTIVDAPVYNINKIGPEELFKKFKYFIWLSLEEEFPYEFQQIQDNAEHNLSNNRNNARGGHG